MKSKNRVLSIVLVVVMIIGFVPLFSLNKGKGVSAATRSEIVNDANSWVGVTPYKWAGTDLVEGCDCSGFVCAIFKRHGLDFINTYGIRTADQMCLQASRYGKVLGKTASKMRDGCLIVFDNNVEKMGHVGICCTDANGNKEVIHAAGTGKGTRRDAISWLCGGPNGLKIAAIIEPRIINGQLSSNIVSGRTPTTATTTTQATTETTTEAVNTGIKTPETNVGYPYVYQKKTINKYDYTGILWVQTALNKIDNSGLVVDGIYGRLTKAAIKNFQRKYGLKVTGKPNKSTVKKLNLLHKQNQVKTLKLDIADAQMGEYGKIVTLGNKVKVTTEITPKVAQAAKIKWKSTNKKVAKISKKGVITPRREGRARIIATAPNGVRCILKIEVKSAY